MRDDATPTADRGSECNDLLGLAEKLRSPWHHGDCKLAADAIERMSAELAQWRKLRDPAILHVNLLRGLPAQLTREQAMHLCGDDLQRMAELEAVAKHEADCAEAYKAEAERLRGMLREAVEVRDGPRWPLPGYQENGTKGRALWLRIEAELKA